jgi:hypothetical protein
MKKLIIQLALVITLVPIGTAVGQLSGTMSGDFRNRVIRNDGASPLPLINIYSEGEHIARLYVLPGETMRFDKSAQPFFGAGYYEAEPNKYFFVQALGMDDWQLDQNLFLPSIRVDKIQWDREGQLTNLIGLRPFVYQAKELGKNFAIISDVKNPKIANGNLYVKLEGRGETEYWLKIIFGNIAAIGQHNATNVAAAANSSPTDEPYRVLTQDDGFSITARSNGKVTEFGLGEVTEFGLTGNKTRLSLVDAAGKSFDVELIHDTFSNGRIETKQFGVLRAAYRVAKPSAYWVISATENQIEKMKEYLAKQPK